MRLGVLYALLAGMVWGIVYITPLMLSDYPPVMQSFARYLAFGLISIPLAWIDHAALRSLKSTDWLEALKLAAVGNFVYYTCLASALQRAGGPLPTMIVGTLPVVIAVCSNLRDAKRDGMLPWRHLLPVLAVMAVGIGLVNHVELQALYASPHPDVWRYASGGLLALIATACWTWYPLRNADWMRRHPARSPRVWATAQGLMCLPMAILGYAVLCAYYGQSGDGFVMPLGPRPFVFVGLMISVGFLASWLGTVCWNEASKRLPTALGGQLIVFETLAALFYAFLWRGQTPAPLALTGIVLLIVGVLWGVNIRPVKLER